MLTHQHLLLALAQNLQTVLIARFFAGCAGSTGSTMVGGTLADIWATHE
jgi:predicted MFS family arabinose efflux permease